MKNEKKTFSFNDFVSGDGLLNFCLSVGVFLLVVTYGGIMYRINPNKVAFSYDVFVSVVEAFFFGLATFLIIRQAQKGWIKMVYAGFEGCAVFLYYNSPYFGTWANFALTTYISIFAAFTFYSLGSISLFRYREQVKELVRQAKKEMNKIEQQSERILNKDGKPFTFTSEQKPSVGFNFVNKAAEQDEQKQQKGFVQGVQGVSDTDVQVLNLINQGYTYRRISEQLNISLGAISRIKKNMNKGGDYEHR